MKYKVLDKQNSSADCMICGLNNPFSPKVKFYICEGEPRFLIGVIHAADHHQSYPNRMHGGMISAVLDETLGRAAQIDDTGIWGVTIELKVLFRKPVPLNEDLYCISYLDNVNRRMFSGTAKLVDKKGTVLATAEGKYARLSTDKIAEGGLTPDNWFYDDTPVPEYIEIGE
jgi:acyl-coenzyme A thioesterase PaaI-like protein